MHGDSVRLLEPPVTALAAPIGVRSPSSADHIRRLMIASHLISAN